MTTLTSVRVDSIVTGERTRQEFRNVESLARSIADRGLLSPINVRLDESGQKILVCGGRRLRAVQSLGWERVPALVMDDDMDELEALLAEGEENTEREPFTPAEAVRHRQRIHAVEAKAAKKRQDEGREHAHESRRLGSSNLDEPSPDDSALASLGFVKDDAPLGIKYRERDHKTEAERTTRHRTAKATGFGATTLDKAQEVIEAAESTMTPEPVREVAREAAKALEKPGAKVDREYRAYREAVAKTNPDVRAANYRKALTQALTRAGDLASYEPDRVIEVADDSLIRTIRDTCEQIARWSDDIDKRRSGGLRVVNGGKQ
ncbi:MAG: ParB/RepB/Spo0J family partition protein [Propionibacteriaceae bacterium]|nr:ParB/RepB/Spo0J family partition protein [Propionibacteriaceae bacterium]